MAEGYNEDVLVLIQDLVENGKTNKTYAKQVMSVASEILRAGDPIPDVMRNYLAEAFEKIADGADCAKALHLRYDRGGARMDLDRIDEIVGLMEALIAKYDLSENQAAQVVHSHYDDGTGDHSKYAKVYRAHRDNTGTWISLAKKGVIKVVIPDEVRKLVKLLFPKHAR